MKLRNKETGEVIELLAKPSFVKRNDDYLQSELNTFNSLAELNEEWEDYEEPKEVWFISNNGQIHEEDGHDKYREERKEIGNYFETKEEAELAVHKLKAWKRLKDTGCKPIMWGWKQDYPNDACYVEVVLKCQFDSGVHDRELDLLFGGEE